MKQLLIGRHAKSSWDIEVADIDRSLTYRGILDAYKIGNAYLEHQMPLDWIYCSPAQRALHTASIFCRVTQHSMERFTISESLYDFSGEQIIQYLRGIDDRHQSVGIFGHNHAVTHVVSWLLGSAIAEIPTAGIYVIQSQVDRWEEFKSGSKLIQLQPKNL